MLSDPYKDDPTIARWFDNEKIERHFDEMIRRDVLSSNDNDRNVSDSLSLLKVSFAATNRTTNKQLISERTIDNAIRTLSNVLTIDVDEHQTRIDTIVSISSYITDTLCNRIESLDEDDDPDFVLPFFTFLCNENIIDSDHLSSDTVWELKTSLQEAIRTKVTRWFRNGDDSHYYARRLNELTDRVSEIIEISFSRNYRSKRYDHLTNAIVIYIKSIYECEGPSSIVGETMRRMLLTSKTFVNETRDDLTRLCTILDYLDGNLSCLNCVTDRVNEFDSYVSDLDGARDDIVKYFGWTRLCLEVMSTVIDDENDDNVDDEEDVDFDAESTRKEVKDTYLTLLCQPEDFLLDKLMDVHLMKILIRYKNVSYLTNRCQV